MRNIEIRVHLHMHLSAINETITIIVFKLLFS